ncbi:hypothetical protein B2G52_04325 [Neisseria lactamica]|uniref:PilS cassette n=1 Tax=Neisseria lactamica TaxID=486 RepID=A0AAU8VDT2_NEILA|nr:hypothetical protein B2G52_04325 [Neisseria lactamica]
MSGIPESSFPRRRESEHVRTETYIPSFPRKRESRISMRQEFIGKNQNPSSVIPTKVGIWK